MQAEDCLSCLLENVTESSQPAKHLEEATAQSDRPRTKQHFESISKQSYQEALEILRSALSLKANAGGAIKAEIKRALKMLAPPPVDNKTESS